MSVEFSTSYNIQLRFTAVLLTTMAVDRIGLWVQHPVSLVGLDREKLLHVRPSLGQTATSLTTTVQPTPNKLA